MRKIGKWKSKSYPTKKHSSVENTIKNLLGKKAKNVLLIEQGRKVEDRYCPIDKTGNSVQTLNRCEELLNEGWNVLIFPEGTSVQNNLHLLPLKEGPARLSIATGKPIVPCNISGVAYTDKEMSSFALPKLQSKIRVKYGKPIYPNNRNVQEINEELTIKIEELGE